MTSARHAAFFPSALVLVGALGSCTPGATPDRGTPPVAPSAPGSVATQVTAPAPSDTAPPTVASAPTPPPTAVPTDTLPSTIPSATLQALADHQRKLQARIEAARTKMSTRDGAGCLTELDAYDKIEPRMTEPTTSKVSPYAMFRAQCLMLAGQCAAGKTLYRDALEHSAGAAMGPDAREHSVDAIVGLYCQGSNLTDRDKVIRGTMALTDGAYINKRTPAFCRENIKTLEETIPKVPPHGPDDSQIINAPDALRNAGTACLAKADDCPGAWTFYQDNVKRVDLYKFAAPDRQELIKKSATMSPSITRQSFEAINRKCAPNP